MLTSPVKYPADESAVKQVISGIRKFKVGSLISSNVEKQSVFQVDTVGTRLTLMDRAGKSTSLIVGKTGPSYSEVYFRLPGSRDVYLGEGIETWTINREVKEWRDKVIFSSPAELIKDLTYTGHGKEYRLHRDSTGWKSEEKSADLSAMNSVLNSLSNLRADDFADNEVQQSNPMKLHIHANEDMDMSLSQMPADSSRYYVQTSRSPQTYIISKWTAQQLLKPVVQPPPVSVAAAPKVKEEKQPPPQPVAAKPTEKKAEPKVISIPKKETTKPTVSEAAKKTTEAKPAAPITEQPKQQAKTPSSTAPQTSPKSSPFATPKTLKPQQPGAAAGSEDEGDLTVHTVVRGETMQTISKKYNVTVEQILKKPGQELYIFVKKTAK